LTAEDVNQLDGLSTKRSTKILNYRLELSGALNSDQKFQRNFA
jgi:hypothetical protein